MSSQTILIPGPLSIGDIVDRAFRIYRARFKPMILTALAILAPLALVTAAVNYLLTVQVLNADQTQIVPALLTMFGTLGVAVLAWLAQGLAELALLFHAHAALRNAPLRPGEAISAAGGRIWSWLGMTLLQGLAYGGLFVALFVVLILPTIALSTLESDAASAIALCCYPLIMLGVLVVFLYLLTRWIVSSSSLVVEGLGATGSLGRSWALTKGKFWRSFAVAFVLFIIRLIVVMLPSYVIQFVAFFTAADLPLPSAIGTFLSAVIAALYVPLTSSAYLVLYYDLRVRKENLDLDQRVEQLAAELQPDEEQPT